MLPGYSVEALFTLFEFQLSCSPAGKESTCNVGDLGSIPGLGRSPGEGKGYPLQYSNLENPMDYIVHGITKSRTRPSDFHLSLSPLYVFPLEGIFLHHSRLFQSLQSDNSFCINGWMLFSPNWTPTNTASSDIRSSFQVDIILNIFRLGQLVWNTHATHIYGFHTRLRCLILRIPSTWIYLHPAHVITLYITVKPPSPLHSSQYVYVCFILLGYT